MYQEIKNLNTQDYDRQSMELKVRILRFLIDDVTDLTMVREALQKKVEEINLKISQRQKKTNDLRELTAELKIADLKEEQLGQELENLERKRQETMIELTRKELAEMTEKIGEVKNEKNRAGRNQAKLSGEIAKAQKDLRELNAEIPVHIHPKRELGKDVFGNSLVVFAFDPERVFLLDEALEMGKVFTGNFEVLSEFLSEFGREQKAIKEKLAKTVELGILDEPRSRKFTSKLFGKSYFAVKEENEKVEEKEKEAQKVETSKIEEETQKIETSKIEEEQIQKNVKNEETKMEQKEEQMEPQKIKIESENQESQTGTKNESQPNEPEKPVQPDPTKIQEPPLKKENEEKLKKPNWIFELSGLENEEEIETFRRKLKTKIRNYENLENQYESMFEEPETRPERKAKGGKLLDVFLGKYYNFLVKRSLATRDSVGFLQELIFYLEEHYNDYLKLLDSFWLSEDKWEEEFYNKVAASSSVEEFRQLLVFLNKSFQMRHFYDEVEDQETGALRVGKVGRDERGRLN